MRTPEEFSDWYNDIVEKAGLADKRYPIKGMNVWTGYGWKAMRLIDTFFREEFDGTGHDEVCFPLLIPQNEFQKEADHIKGFGAEVYWVTHAGENKLDIPLLLRPTSETAMYPIFSLWVRSHADLPLKTYQIVNVFRYETKQTRAFIRMREIHFFEAHTCHRDFEDAERQIQEDLGIMKRLASRLCLPYVLCKRPDWDKFAGAFYTIGIDSIMPTGRTLQMGSIHQYRENFSKPYNITYEDDDGQHKHVHQTTYGMSERILGALISIHNDEKGIILPPDIAPIQVVIIPILSKTEPEKVLAYCSDLYQKVKDAKFRVHYDQRDLRPGNKFYDWEMKGVPLRIEVGARDMQNGVITLARRDTGERIQINAPDMMQGIIDNMKAIQENLYARAKEFLGSSIHDINDLSNVQQGLNVMGWCGQEECGHAIENATEMAVLGEPVNQVPVERTCIVCGKPTDRTIYVARTY
ncbi:MAG: proline--tRNA ligase [Candidatus Thermoplasmatota archaeon]|nr:proline--tRNA ligase [Euryarchaeota archaeon]MBU4031411.1 proline--tRNA ligase [Candidatus Thermoplasmatota archaeon]MBU4072164.1 proline--tRNA ligase [Candidatus Thermoplasmatota archaeon]MBU4145316.1 proline--tRNA ligase [Candidatus Thermoplasmatota archaeon]MBU4592238.1 proline--tRNA ligase [Candidatus Thermoplasmatota archaeon]